MKKVKERAEQNTITVRDKANGSKEARISIKLGGEKGNNRLAKCAKTTDLAVYKLLELVESYIDARIQNKTFNFKINDTIIQKLVKSINNLQIVSLDVTDKLGIIARKINNYNNSLNNVIAIQSNIALFHTSTDIQTKQEENNNSITNTKCPILIEDCFMEWLRYRISLCVKTKDNPKPLSRKTIDINHTILYEEVLPYFKKQKIMYLSQITENHIRLLFKNINSQNSKHKAYIVLNMIFKWAIKNNIATYNPLENVDKPPEKIKTGEGEENDDDNYIEPDRQDIWLNIFEQDGSDMALLFETMLLTGIRPECACGLKWKALDLENNELIINNAYKDFIVYDDNMKSIGHERHDDKLKTPESYRRIPLNPRLRKILLKHKNEQQELFKRARALKNKHKKWSENEYMFLGRNYFPYVAETLCYGMRKFYKKYNLEKITPYGLRHSFATYCSENGMEEIVLMKLMGHTDFQTTQKYYIRVSAKRKRLAMQDAYKVVFFEREAS
jgi:integrase